MMNTWSFSQGPLWSAADECQENSQHGLSRWAGGMAVDVFLETEGLLKLFKRLVTVFTMSACTQINVIHAGAAGGDRDVNSFVVSGELPLLALKMLP